MLDEHQDPLFRFNRSTMADTLNEGYAAYLEYMKAIEECIRRLIEFIASNIKESGKERDDGRV